jgi:hypothetical protein
MNRPQFLSGGRYPVLRALAIIYLLAAAVSAIATVGGALYMLVRFPWGGPLDRTFMAIGALVAGFYVVISMLAIAELIKLVIDIEHNTRMWQAPRTGTMEIPVNVVTASNGGRLGNLDEETAEAALLRGH